MFRSAVLAVLAIALSSSAAAAQSPLEGTTDVDIVSLLPFEYSLEGPTDVDIVSLLPFEYSFEAPTDADITSLLPFEFSFEAPIETRDLNPLAEFAVPAAAESSDSPLLDDPTFAERVESLWMTGVDRTQDILGTARARVSLFMSAAKQEPRLAMHATHGALQLLDLVSTSRALGQGHREGNPLFKNSNMATMTIAKSAAVGLQMFAIERLAKRRPKVALWMTVATNAFMSVVVANNLAIGGQ